jgi:hypothetical protein
MDDGSRKQVILGRVLMGECAAGHSGPFLYCGGRRPPVAVVDEAPDRGVEHGLACAGGTLFLGAPLGCQPVDGNGHGRLTYRQTVLFVNEERP